MSNQHKSLGKILFAYYTEANLGDGHYAIDLSKSIPFWPWSEPEQTDKG